MGANDDLFTALGMFKQSLGELQSRRIISDAQDQVDQIKATETNEAKQRAALQNVANRTVSQMAGLGVPATTIEAVAGSMGPKRYANANAMNLDATLSGDTALSQAAAQQRDFENNPKFELAKLKAMRPTDPFKEAKFEEQKQMSTLKEFEKFSKTIDNTNAVRNAFGKTGQGIQRANQIEALAGKAGDSLKTANALPPQMVAEMATGLASMVKGGQATDSDIKHFLVSSVGMDRAKAEQYLTNGVKGAEAGQFVQLYLKAAHRERAELQAQSDETVLKAAQGNFLLHKRDPELFKQTVADRLGIQPEDVIVDPKTKKVTTTQRMQMDADTAMATDALKQAYAAMQTNDSEARAKAAKVFSGLHVDPNTPFKEAVGNVKYKISRGLL